MKLFIGLILALSLTAKAGANTLLDNANASLDYLRNHVVHQEIENFSEEKVVAAIRDMSLALNHVELTKESVILLKKLRVYAAHSLNNHRIFTSKPVDVALALRAIKDVEFIINLPNNLNDASLVYSAGHIAMHHLKDSILAYEFWNQCAELRHAGCMNIMASETLTGANGSTIDVNKSILWHIRVFETGIKFNCAGSYSAQMLSNLAFFFPKLNTNGDWKYWQEQRDTLLEELESTPENRNICSKESFYLQDYVFNFSLGSQDKDVLGNAIAAANEKGFVEVLEAIRGEEEAQTTIKLIEKVPSDYQKCNLAFNLLLLSKYRNNTDAELIYEEFLYLLDRESCSTELAFIQRLKDQDRWTFSLSQT